MNTATQMGLAARLKEETRPLHTLAERSGVMADLLHGRLTQRGYLGLLRSLHAIYTALEAGLDRHPPDRRLWRPELRRLPALTQDLDTLQPGTWLTGVPLAPAAAAYAARLQQLAQTEPRLLLAHAYLRYLGDLHGGQMLARLVTRQPWADGAPATAFYAFGSTAQVEQLKQDFRAGLDALVLTESQADAFVAEACDAFRRHQRLFEELQA